MPRMERTRSVRIELDGMVGLGQLEEAALAFARSAPAQLVADTIESMIGEMIDAVVGPFGDPWPVRRQLVARWSCTGCGSHRGFRRRGFRPKARKVMSACGAVAFRSQQLECLRCGRRFAPANELLGLRPHQRRTDRLSELAAGLAGEVAYAKASRLLAELTGPEVSSRTIRRDVLALAPERIGPAGAIDVPILLLDGTGERAGPSKGGVELHLAIGLVARRRGGGRIKVEARLLAATVAEPWAVMNELLAEVRPGLIVVDGEDAVAEVIATTFASTPVQRCLFHLARTTAWLARYRDHASKDLVADLRDRLEDLLTTAHRDHDLQDALTAYDQLAEDLDNAGCRRAALHLRRARDETFTFLTHPDAGRLVLGDKGRPELGTGVLERVMRELNRRTDNGVRWTIAGLRAVLMIKLQHKYRHGPWSPPPTTTPQPKVRFSLAA